MPPNQGAMPCLPSALSQLGEKDGTGLPKRPAKLKSISMIAASLILHNVAGTKVPVAEACRIEPIERMLDVTGPRTQLRPVEFAELFHSVATHNSIVQNGLLLELYNGQSELRQIGKHVELMFNKLDRQTACQSGQA